MIEHNLDEPSQRPLLTHVTRRVGIAPITVSVRPRVRIHARSTILAFADEEGDDGTEQ